MCVYVRVWVASDMASPLDRRPDPEVCVRARVCKSLCARTRVCFRACFRACVFARVSARAVHVRARAHLVAVGLRLR